MKFCFGDIVVIYDNEIGVVVKSWEVYGRKGKSYQHEVYCRMSGTIEIFSESEMERYMVRHKELDEQEMKWQAQTRE